jgi:hypothetical protein
MMRHGAAHHHHGVPTRIQMAQVPSARRSWYPETHGPVPARPILFFMGIPRELEDAAALDGAGVMSTIFRVILPVSIPVIVTVIVFQIQYSWNDFLAPWCT